MPTVNRSGLWQKVALFGPGLALAATSVGAGDLVIALEGAGSFGMGLVWVAAGGLVIKYVLTEASAGCSSAAPRS